MISIAKLTKMFDLEMALEEATFGKRPSSNPNYKAPVDNKSHIPFGKKQPIKQKEFDLIQKDQDPDNLPRRKNEYANKVK